MQIRWTPDLHLRLPRTVCWTKLPLAAPVMQAAEQAESFPCDTVTSRHSAAKSKTHRKGSGSYWVCFAWEKGLLRAICHSASASGRPIENGYPEEVNNGRRPALADLKRSAQTAGGCERHAVGLILSVYAGGGGFREQKRGMATRLRLVHDADTGGCCEG
ncbi:hypothetical protein BDV96DRAFT_576358 [Lophiotrema nucula]|uniref:Uncharacterized protein n=1 Tax=Lophiotrema nucula TaxID=690887 RepID=A0A6A5Z6I1_9PLEO|nr:hypothetical protein BDV96DRAFT_576358 [Lophiotrema nucula]